MILRRLSRYAVRGVAAGLGLLLAPTARLFRSSGLSLLDNVTIALIFTGIAVWFGAFYIPVLFFIGGWLGFAIAGTALQGARLGWREGIMGVFNYLANRRGSGSRRGQGYADIIARTPSQPASPTAPVSPSRWRDAQFVQNKLTDDEIKDIYANRQPLLTEAELAELNRLGREDVARWLARYETLVTFPDSECPINLEKVTAEHAVLLSKQYFVNKKYQPAIGYSYIYGSEEALKEAVRARDVNPLTQENLTSPTLYDRFPTRFVYHPAFIKIPENGKMVTYFISQELNVLISRLKHALNPQASDESVISPTSRSPLGVLPDALSDQALSDQETGSGRPGVRPARRLIFRPAS